MIDVMIRKRDGSPVRFILIDDSRAIRNALKVCNKLLGGEVIGEAEDGIEGVQLYKRCRPYVVLCDIEMPRLNGIDTVRILSKCDPQSKVIMVSSLAHQAKVKEAIEAGAAHFIVKPFKPIEAARKLKTILERFIPTSEASTHSPV